MGTDWQIVISSEECPYLFGSPRREYCGYWSSTEQRKEPYHKCTPANCPRRCVTERELRTKLDSLMVAASMEGSGSNLAVALEDQLIAKLTGRDDGQKGGSLT